MQSLLEKREIIKSQSSKFDDRTNLALSDGVVKKVIHSEELDYFDYAELYKITSDQGYFQKRIAHEISLLSEFPENVKLLIRVGDIYFANKKPDKAKTFFNRAYKIEPNNLTVNKRLVEVFMAKGKPEQADGLLSLFSGKLDNETIHLHAIIKLVTNQFDSAEKLISQISENAKNYHEAINSLGLIQLSKDQAELAQRSFEKSIAANKKYAPAKANLAISYQKRGNVNSAVNQYKKTIDEHKDYVTAYNNLYNLYVSLDRIQEAFELMDSARGLITPDNEIQFRIGWSLMALGRLDKAIVEYHKVLELLPGNSNTLNNIGHCYDRLGDAKSAYKYFEMAAKTNKPNTFEYLPYRNLMVISSKLGDIRMTRTIADNILKHSPDDPFALVFKGEELVGAEKWDDAFKVLSKAYEAKPPLISLYISLSFLYSDIFPDYEKGMEVCEYPLNNNVENAGEVINNLVHMNLINGHLDVAERYLNYLNNSNSISLSTLALYDLHKDKIPAAIAKYDKAMGIVNPKYVDRIKQRKYYDLGMYYLDKNNKELAKENFAFALNDAPGGFEFVKKNISEIIKNI